MSHLPEPLKTHCHENTIPERMRRRRADDAAYDGRYGRIKPRGADHMAGGGKRPAL